MKITKEELKTLDELFEKMYEYMIYKNNNVQYAEKYKILRKFHTKVQEELKK